MVVTAMTDRPVSTTRRRYIASASALLGALTAGCSTLDARRRDLPVSTTELTTHSDSSPHTETTPELNRTPYPAVQQRTDGSAITEKTVILSTDEWRNRISVSQLGDETVELIGGTDFESSYVVGFEVPVTEWGYYLQLEVVERRSNRVRIEYADAFVEGGPNVEQTRAMFVRLPRRGSVPKRVALKRTDNEQ